MSRYLIIASTLALFAAACGEDEETVPNSDPAVSNQTGDYPTGRWLLATQGCGLDDARQPVGGAEGGALPGQEGDFGGGGPNGVADASSSWADTSGEWEPDNTPDAGFDFTDTTPDADVDTTDVVEDPCDVGDAGDAFLCDEDVVEGSGEEGSGEEGSGSEGSGEEGSGEEGSGSEGSGEEGSGSEGSGDMPDSSEKDETDGPTENPWTDTVEDALATFSSDIDTASYTRARAALNEGRLPNGAEVRVEDFLNYFKYPYPAPIRGESDPFFISLEAAPTPFAPAGTSTLRVAIQGAVLENCERPPANLVFLVDVSGSMGSPGKLDLAQYAIIQMARALNVDDRVSIVTYAGWVEELLGPTPATDLETIERAVQGLTGNGGTAGGAGLALAYEVAQRGFIEGGINRVVLATDGDFNLGISGDALIERIASERDSGITLSALGFGTSGYSDSQLNGLADEGNGNYVFIDSEREADNLVNNMLMATLLVIGRDLKIQIELESEFIRSYRVLGYDTRELQDDQFADDHVDAGDVGAGHAVTALVEIEWMPVLKDGITIPARGEFATINVRYKPAWESETSVLLRRAFGPQDVRASFEEASDTFRLAAAVAEFAEILRESEHSEGAQFDVIRDTLMSMDIGGDARTEMIALVEQASRLYGAR
jgi:Ca-activated chloride channel family protein